MPENKDLLGVRHGQRNRQTDGRWVLKTRNGVFIKDFPTEADLESWWQIFQMIQGRKPLPLDEGREPKRKKKQDKKRLLVDPVANLPYLGNNKRKKKQEKKRQSVNAKKRRISEQLDQIRETGVIAPPHSSGTGGMDHIKPWSDKYDMPEYDLE